MADPITPPPELVQQWASTQAFDIAPAWMLNDVATQAAQWGADQELEACCEWLDYNHPSVSVGHLRAARRPSPQTLSLKQQAMAVLDDVDTELGGAHYNILLRALEALPDD
jgi:hypothetical protein